MCLYICKLKNGLRLPPSFMCLYICKLKKGTRSFWRLIWRLFKRLLLRGAPSPVTNKGGERCKIWNGGPSEGTKVKGDIIPCWWNQELRVSVIGIHKRRPQSWGKGLVQMRTTAERVCEG